MSPRTQIQSVHRAATVLELVAGNGGMRASQIATRLDVPLPTVFHLLSTLTDVGLLDKLDDRRYQLGPMAGLLAEAYAAQVSAPEHLHARLQEMAERTGETAYLSAWRRGDATLLSIVEGRRAVRVSGLHLGYSGATHARASGKVLLTFSGPTALDEYLEHHDLTNPSTTPKALRAVIERTRQDGYAVDEEEFAEGVVRGGADHRRPHGHGHLGAVGAVPREPRAADRAGARDHFEDHQTQQRDRRCPVSGVLDGKVALVTGAGTGLGRGIAQALAEAGADVAVAEINGESGEVAARELAETGVRTKAYETDVAKSDQVERAFTSCVADLGRIDIVVNNAGISRVGPHTQDVTDEDWADSIAVMQSGVFYCMRAAGRIMIDQGSGSVINISSIRGYSPNPGRMTYCAPKAAVIMMTKIAAGEWAQFGVRANAIAPGVLRTPMWDADVERGAIDEGFYLDMVPAKRLGMPSEVGALAVYLGSDDASYVNGSIIPIDGALTAIPAG